MRYCYLLLGGLIFVNMQFSSHAHSIVGKPHPHLKLETLEQTTNRSSAADLLNLLGAPHSHYHQEGAEYWIYGNVSKFDKQSNQKLGPILMLKGQKLQQINWLPVDIIQKSIKIAKAFANWTPPTKIRLKAFFLADTQVVGLPKSRVLSKFGSPDGKWIFNGIEIWEYQQVRVSAQSNQIIRILVEFDGEKVRQTVS